MYGYQWTDQNGVYRLVPNAKVIKEIRPVFKEELNNFGLNRYWQYPDTEAPLLWAEGIRRYVLNGEVVAEATGGSFYAKPTIIVKRTDLTLQEIDVARLWEQNESLMRGLEDTAVKFIRRVHDDYLTKGMKFVVAFSGGKDSLVLLDLVAKSLRPDEFVVIFSNTGMELKVTLEAVKRAKSHYSKLRFYEASSHMTPEQSWDAFGPPGRRLRWCCAVHKSVPTILALRSIEISGDYDAKAVVYDGVRKEESSARAMYDAIGEGVKNVNQINCSPILEWGTAEVYLYLIKNQLLFNEAYRLGLFRVGCKVCPLASSWWDGIANDSYPHELASLLTKVEEYAHDTKTVREQRKYVESGGWKGRMGGRGLKQGGNRVTEVIDGDKIIFKFASQASSWLEVAKILGEIVEKNGDTYTQLINHRSFTFILTENTVIYQPYSAMDRFVVSHLRGVANKAAYCVGCKACVVQCPNGAFEITEKNTILIREELCIHCGNCIEFTGTKGCLAAKSLYTTGGNGMNLKGMSPYQHFGFRRPWLEHFFKYGTDCFTQGQLGNRQYDALRVWLREAELLSPTNKGDKSGTPTALCERLIPFGADNPMVWAIIWTNLAYHSIISKWYMLYTRPGEIYTKSELVFLLGDDYSPSTRDNAIKALFETLRHSPIGISLKQGIPIPDGASYKILKQGWDTPEATAILYAFYKFAEETGRFSFTLTQLDESRGKVEAKGVDPVAIFGLDPHNFKAIVQDIALQYSDFIRVAFVQDLDNIMLEPTKKSIDVLDIITE